MYTTVECEFFEDTYYYEHLSSQGENTSQDLTWLSYPKTMSPGSPEQVGRTTESTSKSIIHHPPTTIRYNEHPTFESTEVSLEDNHNIDSNTPNLESFSDADVTFLENNVNFKRTREVLITS